MTRLVLVDGNAMAHRAYHAMPPLTTPQGEPIGAVQGFVNILLKLVENLHPTYLAVCFDRKEKTFRKKEFAKYQAHRPETDKDLSSQFGKIRDVLSAMNILTFDKKGYEADDLIGTIAKTVSKKKSQVSEVVIVTGDKDQLQLVSDFVSVYMPIKGLNNSILLGPKEVYGKMGVHPEKVIDLKALMGDSSDNYPGVYGIGPKTALKLISEFGDYKSIYKNLAKIEKKTAEKLQKGKEGGDMSYKLATIVTDLAINFDLQNLKSWNLSSSAVVELFKSYGFRTLPKRVEKFKKKEDSLPILKNKLTKAEVEKTARLVAQRLHGTQYAIRGTASLVLQGFDMGVDDIDVLGNKDMALSANKLLREYLLEEVDYKESDKYKSYFGKFVIAGILVEVYGEWQMKITKREGKGLKEWSKVWDATENEVATVTIDGQDIKVTTIATELATAALMGRWNEYHKIKKQFDARNQQSLF